MEPDGAVDLDRVINLGPPNHGPIRVRFGPNEHQVIQLSWAEHILSRLFVEQRKKFGEYLLEAMQGPGDGK